MDGGGHFSQGRNIGRANPLPFEDKVTCAHEWPWRAAYALVQRNDEKSRRWRDGDRKLGSVFFVRFRLHATIKIE